MSGLDDSRLRRTFIEEAEELSEKLGECLAALERNRTDAALVNEIFRLTHSLKSESALMGFSALSAVAHRMEDILGLARSGSLALEKAVVGRLVGGADLIAEMMGAIAQGGSDSQFPTTEVLSALSEAAGLREPGESAPQRTAALSAGSGSVTAPGADGEGMTLGEPELAQLSEARDRGEHLFRVTVRVAEEETMKFPRAVLVFSNLEAACNVVKVVPSMEGSPADDAQFGTLAFLLTAEGEAVVSRAAAGVDQIADVKIEACPFDAFLAGASALAAGSQLPAGEPVPSEPAGKMPGVSAVQEDGRRRPAARASIRVDTRKLDDLWSMVAELVLRKVHIGRLSEAVGRGMDPATMQEELSEAFDSLDKISAGMQQAMVDTRMIPISVIFSKLPRLVRDLSRKLGKPADLVMSGEDTEIDRSVVEALSDPLTHIIRNALDHGIEFPEERVRRGKPERGRVAVSARRQGGTIVIELADDGRGIDTETIRRKAVAAGLAGAGAFTEDQLLELVFLPGFSTKDVVTDLSGRGVGMDVVATRIRGELKGEVSVHTERLRGTRVTLFLPLTLTIVNALLVRGESQVYALPLADVESTAKLVNSEIRGESGRETARWGDDELPVFSLGGLFGSGRRRAEESFAVVIRHGERAAYLVVDELIEEREIVIKPADDLVNPHRLFSGVAVLENGRLVFILDTSFVRRENFSRETAWAPRS